MTVARKYVVAVVLAGVLAAIGVALGAESDRIQLGHGQHGEVAWSVSLRDSRASESPRAACLDIAIRSKHLGSEATECGAARSDLPLFDRLAIGKGKHRITVFGAVMPPAVKRVALGLASRGYQKMRVRHLGAKAAKSAGVEQFAYLTRSFAGPVCVKRLRAYGADGALITDLPFFHCHES
jgi:hypothetical protein